MISMRKQLFSLLLCTGVFTITLTSLSVNVTIVKQFQAYVQSNIQKNSMLIVNRLENSYNDYGGWNESVQDELIAETQFGNFAVSILDKDKKLLWGVTQAQLEEKVNNQKYPWAYSKAYEKLTEPMYIFEDIPIQLDSKELIGYARIGYFPSFLLTYDDVLFQSKINNSIIGSGIVAVLCFVFIGAYITTMFTHPIYEIARTTGELAQGEYGSRYLHKSRITELEALRESINFLAHKLEQQDTLRKKLISDVSHEIRTPLHILQSNLEAMIDGIYPIDEEQMQVLYEEVVRFGSLLSNLDKLKNVEDEPQAIKKQSLELNTCLQEVYQTFKIVARERGIHYTLQVKPTQQAMILADRGAMKQILMNVLSNAFKFTQQGAISITTAVEGRMAVITIEDTGIGIAKEDTPYVFERLYRGDKSREKYEGSGIGLTIVKRLVQMHEGTIRIESEENLGTKVKIRLPIISQGKNKNILKLTVKA